jgi:hypothetical protein
MASPYGYCLKAKIDRYQMNGMTIAGKFSDAVIGLWVSEEEAIKNMLQARELHLMRRSVDEKD